MNEEQLEARLKWLESGMDNLQGQVNQIRLFQEADMKAIVEHLKAQNKLNAGLTQFNVEQVGMNAKIIRTLFPSATKV